MDFTLRILIPFLSLSPYIYPLPLQSPPENQPKFQRKTEKQIKQKQNQNKMRKREREESSPGGCSVPIESRSLPCSPCMHPHLPVFIVTQQ